MPKVGPRVRIHFAQRGVTCEPDFLDQIRKFVKCSGAIVPVELLPDLVPRINVDSGDFAGLSGVLDKGHYQFCAIKVRRCRPSTKLAASATIIIGT
jgi:hypothetical protein